MNATILANREMERRTLRSLRDGCLTDRTLASARLMYDIARSINHELDTRPGMFGVQRQPVGGHWWTVKRLEMRQAASEGCELVLLRNRSE